VKTLPPQRPKLSELGRIDSVCPYCERELSRRPERKSRCPHCGDSVFVRIRPFDRKRVLLTEQQTSAEESEWTALQLWMKRRRETGSG
jgi:DNA-directed RNA polymerase subunit RPC12/RpoP